MGSEVDLRGKKGVVDPKDLKKYDPKPPPPAKEPPPPKEDTSEHYEVKKSHEGTKNETPPDSDQ